MDISVDQLKGLHHKVLLQEMLDLDWDDSRGIITDLIDEAIARQSVTDEKIQDVIEVMKEFGWGNPDAKHHFDLAITALRQMRTEPCEYCDGKQKYKRIDEKHSWNIWKFMDGHCVMKVWTDMGNSMCGISFPVENCPDCGRDLKGAE